MAQLLFNNASLNEAVLGEGALPAPRIKIGVDMFVTVERRLAMLITVTTLEGFEMEAFNIGDDVVIRSRLLSNEGAAVEPGALRFRVKLPDTSVVEKVAGEDAEIVHDDLGDYYWRFPVTQSGTHYIEVIATGNNKCAGDAQFTVKKSYF